DRAPEPDVRAGLAGGGRLLRWAGLAVLAPCDGPAPAAVPPRAGVLLFRSRLARRLHARCRVRSRTSKAPWDPRVRAARLVEAGPGRIRRSLGSDGSLRRAEGGPRGAGRWRRRRRAHGR